MAMVDSPLPGPAGCCWGNGGGGALLPQRRLRRRRQQQQQQQQQIQLEEEQEAEREEEGLNSAVDHIDRLPDSVLLLVFNRIGDVKALGRCCAVSRRFHALVPEVDDLLVRVDCVIPDDDDDAASSSSDASSSGPRRGLFSHLARLVLGGIARPLQAISQILAIFPIGGSAAGKDASLSSSSAVWDYRRRHASPPAPAASSPSDAASPSHHSPTEVLRNFREMRRLRIELPTGEVGVDDGVLLKWRANFGSTLNNCVILGASSLVSSSSSAAATPSPVTEKSAAGGTNSSTDGAAGSQLAEEGSCRPDGAASSFGGDDGGAIPESSFYAHGGLKQRVMWTISSLIAAAARHHMLQPIVADHGALESLDVVDAEGQGVLRMDRGQMEELRGKPVVPTAPGSPQRTLVPSLEIRLWHARQVELSDGMVLQGATVVAIRPIEDPAATAGKQEDMSWVSGAFEEEEVYGSAVRQLIKGRMHCLEMNSF